MDNKVENCWATIGVWGSEMPRCPRLDEVIHCRDCDVFTKAGRNLLEREMPADYIQEWTRLLYQEKDATNKETVSAVVVRLGKEWMALPTNIVKEIAEMRPMHIIPNVDNRVIKGIVFIRGELYICVSIGELLGLTSSDRENDSDKKVKFTERLVIISKDEKRFAFPATDIVGTQRILVDNIKDVPSTISKAKSSFMTGVFELNEQYVGLLDDNGLFDGLERSLR